MYRLARITTVLFFATIIAVGCSSDSGTNDDGGVTPTPDQGTTPTPDQGTTPTPDKGPTQPEPTETLLMTVANTMTLPSKAGEYALDLDGSGPKNQFGSLLAAMKSFNLDMQPELDKALEDGAVLILMEVKGKDLTDDTNVLVQAHTGEDTDGDATNNFSGSAELKIAASSSKDAKLPGTIAGGKINAGPGSLVIPMPIGDTPLLVPIQAARLEGEISADGMANGVLAGAISKADLDAKVLPSVVELVNGMLTNPDVTQETKDMVLQVLDADKNGTIDIADMQGGLIGQALAPDIDTDGDGTADALSIGIGFTTVTAVLK